MADFEHQLRQHYESQKLPDDRARAILEAGRAVAAARARRARWLLGAAAVLALALGILGGGAGIGGKASRGDSRRIVLQDAASALVSYFSQPDYQLAEVSADRAVLEKWLREHGAPDSLAVPRTMAALPSFGCQVLEARGQRVFLICFFLDAPPVDPGAGAMPIKRDMEVTAPDGTIMKKNRPLVHLMVAPRAAFRDAPAPGTNVRFSATGEWNFETWSQGEVVYVVGATLPGDRLADFARAL